MPRVTPNLTFGHKFKIHLRAATKICCLKLEAIVFFLYFVKSQNICFSCLCFKFCMHNTCYVLPLSCPESHNAFSCILIRASLIVTGQDTVSNSPVSLNICILLCSVPAPVTKQGDQNLNMNITKLTHKISTHTGRSFCWLRPVSQQKLDCVKRESGSCVQRAHHQQIRALPIKLIEKYES